MTVGDFNKLPKGIAREHLAKCCGSRSWVAKMMEARPFAGTAGMMAAAQASWDACTEEDGREAFLHHPKIGNMDALAAKFATTAKWAEGEQASVKQASQATLQALADGNNAYEQKFGYIFIVCATGKSAEEMLGLLQSRLPNAPDVEIRIAMAEQMKITLIRLEKLLNT